MRGIGFNAVNMVNSLQVIKERARYSPVTASELDLMAGIDLFVLLVVREIGRVTDGRGYQVHRCFLAVALGECLGYTAVIMDLVVGALVNGYKASKVMAVIHIASRIEWLSVICK